MAVVAGFFDTDDAATRALDDLMHKPGMQDIETKVISTRSNFGDQEGGGGIVAAPINPGTLGNAGQGVMGGGPAGLVPVTGFDDSGLFRELPHDERDYFSQALRKGGVLVLAKVDDDRDSEVRSMFHDHGARVYEK